MFVREVRLRAALLLVTWSVGTALSFTRKLPGRFFLLQKAFFFQFSRSVFFFSFHTFGRQRFFHVSEYVFFQFSPRLRRPNPNAALVNVFFTFSNVFLTFSPMSPDLSPGKSFGAILPFTFFSRFFLRPERFFLVFGPTFFFQFSICENRRTCKKKI